MSCCSPNQHSQNGEQKDIIESKMASNDEVMLSPTFIFSSENVSQFFDWICSSKIRPILVVNILLIFLI